MRITTTSPAETAKLAERIGTALCGGEVIELVSDLGGGKTTFTKGLAKGLGITDAVSSPTFTVSREYQGVQLRLYHFDFYRLHEAGVMSAEFHEATEDPHGVVVVEWADIVKNVLPESRVQITITATDEASRELEIAYPDSLGYIAGALL